MKHLLIGNYEVLLTGCWRWKGALDKNGYGTRRVGGRGKNKNWFAHRLSYQEFVAPLTEGLQINHTCDNPSCINPEHLYEGTQQQNMQDVKKRGRTLGVPKPKLQGQNHPRAKLTEEDVLRIREKKKQGFAMKSLWKEGYPHVSYSAIVMAARGENFKYV